MLLWALDNPPPANILLVSGDGDFANALHRLRLKTYSILLAIPAQSVKPALTGAAKKLWFWKDIAQGILAGPESKQLTSGASSKDLVGLSSLDSMVMREVSLSLGTSVIQNPLVSNGYASPQKATSTSEHFRSLNLMNHTSSVYTQNRGHPCGQEMTQKFSQDSKVPQRTVFNASCSSNPTSVQYLQTVSGDKCTDLVQEPSLMPECVKRVDSSGEPFPKGPLRHIIPNANNKGTDNLSLVRNTNHKLPRKYDGAKYHGIKANDPHRNRPILSPSSDTLENKLEKLSHSSCLDKVYIAMKTLQRDMLAPSENNLSECIQYWDPQSNRVNVKETLEIAAASCQVTKAQMGGGLIMYLPPDHCIPWDCVDPGNLSLIHHVDAWVELQRFLLNGEKKQKFLSSCSRYNSAMILKTSCGPHIQKMTVGEISNLIQRSIIDRKWLRKVGPGSGPLILNQKLVIDWSAGRRQAADIRQHTNEGSPQPNAWKPDLPPSAEKASDKNTAHAE
ncbi:hypothetical protein KP509_21G012800 [Ceratopteris richardii]|nr:hypothetical protein KP509_21G012800 [Ceratopteris richardii]